jgi:hypothetical protein
MKRLGEQVSAAAYARNCRRTIGGSALHAVRAEVIYGEPVGTSHQEHIHKRQTYLLVREDVILGL